MYLISIIAATGRYQVFFRIIDIIFAELKRLAPIEDIWKLRSCP